MYLLLTYYRDTAQLEVPLVLQLEEVGAEEEEEALT